MTQSREVSNQSGNGSTALEREADRVELLQSSSDKSNRGKPAPGTAEQGGSPQAEQDRRIDQSRRKSEARDDGTDAFEQGLNQDG